MGNDRTLQSVGASEEGLPLYFDTIDELEAALDEQRKTMGGTEQFRKYEKAMRNRHKSLGFESPARHPDITGKHRTIIGLAKNPAAAIAYLQLEFPDAEIKMSGDSVVMRTKGDAFYHQIDPGLSRSLSSLTELGYDAADLIGVVTKGVIETGATVAGGLAAGPVGARIGATAGGVAAEYAVNKVGELLGIPAEEQETSVSDMVQAGGTSLVGSFIFGTGFKGKPKYKDVTPEPKIPTAPKTTLPAKTEPGQLSIGGELGRDAAEQVTPEVAQGVTQSVGKVNPDVVKESVMDIVDERGLLGLTAKGTKKALGYAGTHGAKFLSGVPRDVIKRYYGKGSRMKMYNIYGAPRMAESAGNKAFLKLKRFQDKAGDAIDDVIKNNKEPVNIQKPMLMVKDRMDALRDKIDAGTFDDIDREYFDFYQDTFKRYFTTLEPDGSRVLKNQFISGKEAQKLNKHFREVINYDKGLYGAKKDKVMNSDMRSFMSDLHRELIEDMTEVMPQLAKPKDDYFTSVRILNKYKDRFMKPKGANPMEPFRKKDISKPSVAGLLRQEKKEAVKPKQIWSERLMSAWEQSTGSKTGSIADETLSEVDALVGTNLVEEGKNYIAHRVLSSKYKPSLPQMDSPPSFRKNIYVKVPGAHLRFGGGIDSTPSVTKAIYGGSKKIADKVTELYEKGLKPGPASPDQLLPVPKAPKKWYHNVPGLGPAVPYMAPTGREIYEQGGEDEYKEAMKEARVRMALEESEENKAKRELAKEEKKKQNLIKRAIGMESSETRGQRLKKGGVSDAER